MLEDVSVTFASLYLRTLLTVSHVMSTVTVNTSRTPNTPIM